MFDAKRLLDQFLGGQTGTGAGGKPGKGFDPAQLGDLARGFGGLGGGTLAGGLAGVLLGSKKGRKLGGSALKLGGLALVGGLAYKAYRDWQAGKQPVPASERQDASMLPPPGGTPFNPSTEAEQQSLGRHLLRAMIAAAKADGHVDAQEQASIFAAMDKLDLDVEDKAFVMDELRAPLDIDAVAKAARTPEEAAEIYTASLLAIDVDNAAERGYLSLLAARLNLDDKLVEHLHATVEGAIGKA
ncbi:MAG TPA: tellurite resistance TerB family protein [Arenibaculum sp.]|nr:tellurite resistance TerB family protein [Arenibaculum sp.]